MEPFKLKPGLQKDSLAILEVAKDCFGSPTEVSFYGEGFVAFSATWRSIRQINTATMSISHRPPREFLDCDFQMEATRISPYDREVPSEEGGTLWWEEPWHEFAAKVRKPWEEWTDEELMESVSWCRQFVEAGFLPSDGVHTFMVMKSFEFPEDSEVKGYFRSWQRKMTESNG